MGIPDEQWGQALRIVMTKDAGKPSLSLGELRSLISESIGRVAAPRSLLLLSEMPTMSNGKIDFAKLMSTKPTESI
jgi:acyl-CoA synthetase (AMP-forming)/AMP-acid ligase II